MKKIVKFILIIAVAAALSIGWYNNRQIEIPGEPISGTITGNDTTYINIFDVSLGFFKTAEIVLDTTWATTNDSLFYTEGTAPTVALDYALLSNNNHFLYENSNATIWTELEDDVKGFATFSETNLGADLRFGDGTSATARGMDLNGNVYGQVVNINSALNSNMMLRLRVTGAGTDSSKTNYWIRLIVQ